MGTSQTNVGGPWFIHPTGVRAAWLDVGIHAAAELPEPAWAALRAAATGTTDGEFRAAIVAAWGGADGARMGLVWDVLPAVDAATAPLHGPDVLPLRTRVRMWALSLPLPLP